MISYSPTSPAYTLSRVMAMAWSWYQKSPSLVLWYLKMAWLGFLFCDLSEKKSGPFLPDLVQNPIGCPSGPISVSSP